MTAPEPDTEERVVEVVARAIAQTEYESVIDADAFEHCFDEIQRDEFRTYARAAVAAYRAQDGGAEEAVRRVEALAAYLRDALESLAAASGVSVNAEYGPKPNGVLLDDLNLWIGGVRCRHCGSLGVPGDDHTCSCPKHDNDCTEHPDPCAALAPQAGDGARPCSMCGATDHREWAH